MTSERMSPITGACLKPCPLQPKRSEEHTSELQSQSNLVCRLLLEKKKTSETTLALRSGCSVAAQQIASDTQPDRPSTILSSSFDPASPASTHAPGPRSFVNLAQVQ